MSRQGISPFSENALSLGRNDQSILGRIWCGNLGGGGRADSDVSRDSRSIVKKLTEIQQILGYACANQDWGSGEVANWPPIIRSEIENSNKEDSYREDG